MSWKLMLLAALLLVTSASKASSTETASSKASMDTVLALTEIVENVELERDLLQIQYNLLDTRYMIRAVRDSVRILAIENQVRALSPNIFQQAFRHPVVWFALGTYLGVRASHE